MYDASPDLPPREGRGGGMFRSWPVLEQLPTGGAEADIYIVGTALEKRVLKLYRSKIEPNADVLSRIAEVSRANRHCFVEFHETGYDEETGRWYELQEFIAHGSLANVPPAVKNTVQFADMSIPELAEAIFRLHENGIVHCDIKPANILVRSLEPLELVLADFGISSLMAADASRKMTGLKGTPMYWAPESFSREIGRPCDWWGMGMVTLELLAGEHPFDGLSDSQIIHRLTIGNVTVPDTIDTDHSLLIKGLLTRDDSLRWGKGEIDRWLSGERDIPVFYAAQTEERAHDGVPLRFEGNDCRDAEAIARAYAASETPWSAPRDHIRLIRSWLESNLKFDEAARMARLAASETPELELFRYVHSNARLPFSMMGHVVTAESLAECARKHLEHRGTLDEHRVAELIAGGSIEEYYEIYRSYSGESDIRGLVYLLSRKPAETQAEYLDAILNPSDYLWPRNLAGASREELTEVMRLMSAVPLERGFFEDLTAKYVIPNEIISMLESTPEEYAEGAATLKSWAERDLLLPLGSEHDEIYANMSAAEYERTGRILRLGHTSATLAQSEAIAAALDFLYDREPVLDTNHVKETAEAMRRLSSRKVTPRDTAFLVKMTALLEERELALGDRWIKRALPPAFTGVVFWFAHTLSGSRGDLFFQGTLLLSLTGVVIFYFAFLGRIGTPRETRGYVAALPGLAAFMLAGALIMYRTVMPEHPHLFSYAIGAAPSLVFVLAREFWKTLRNSAAILEACDSYSDGKPSRFSSG
jgi:Ser/Thr protein kinase RdoA (MazF antagonist)